jgi:hypothetical protein
MTLLGQVDTGYTTTPWYVTWFEEYNEIHIQSAPEDSDNHVVTIHYRHSETCPAHAGHHRNDPYDSFQCECGGLREAMSNAKLIVESVNEQTFGGQLLVNTTLFEEVGV